MKTPFSLRLAGSAATEPASGLLLLSSDPADVLSLLAQIGPLAGGSPPTIHEVAGGFLIRLPQSVTHLFPGVVRLRQRAPNLFLPVAAELRPTLFPDEASALVQKRGLVFLPCGQALAFEPDRSVPLSRFVAARRLPLGPWRPLPEPPLLADRLSQVLLDRPDDSPETVFSTGGEDIGVEEPEPPKVGPAGRARASIRQGLGQGLSWLGRKLGWKRLAQLGSQMADAARQMLQAISDSARGRQEAALRALLRKFQEGKLEEALRRALPFGEGGGRGNQPTGDSSLPTHNTSYSLGNILGGAGPGGLWTVGLDVQAQLAAEYRKAAEAATARGDYRRAAFIYGKLLRDYRLAADALSRGGLHHDAAILYLEKVQDVLAAARSFEAAGEFDRAVQLYRQRKQHVLAGDLLRRIGDEQQAVREYEQALEQLLQSEVFLAAGNLALEKLHRTETAEACFWAGWNQRPSGSPLPCLHRLVRLLAEGKATAYFLTVVDEATRYLEQHGSENDCSSFFTEVVRLADRPNLAGVRDRLRDKALLGLAARLRSRAQVESSPGNLVSTLFGQSGLWSAPQVSDAEAAWRASLPTRKVASRPAGKRAIIQTRLHYGTVQAACVAGNNGQLFVAFADGTLCCFDPMHGALHSLPALTGSVCSLATDPKARMLLALSLGDQACYELATYLYVGESRYSPLLTRKALTGPGPGAQLSPLVFVGSEPRGVVWWQDGLVVLHGANPLPVGRTGAEEREDFPDLEGVLPVPTPEWNRLLLFNEQAAALCWVPSYRLVGAPLGWIARPRPGLLASQTFRTSRVGEGMQVEVVRVGAEDGRLLWSRLLVEDANRLELQTSAISKTEGYLGATQISPQRLAAIHEGGIDWLYVHRRRLEVVSSTAINLGGACGCFFSPPTGELLIVCRDGYLVRVGTPT